MGDADQDILYPNNGDTTFTQTAELTPGVGDSVEGANLDVEQNSLGDFNGDGRLDIYHIKGWDSKEADTVYLNTANLEFIATDGPETYIGDFVSEKLDIARLQNGDFNGDGSSDIYYIQG